MNENRLTVHGCCDSIKIVRNDTLVEFDEHVYQVTMVYCKACGSKKSGSHITHIREN